MLTSSVLVLRLFGEMEARLDDAPLSGLHLREGERLLAYLTLRHGQTIAYRQLALLFWPFEARQNDEWTSGDFPSTRQAIHALRRALGEHAWRLASVGKGIIRFDLDGADVDVIAFERLVQEESDANGWRKALSLHRGPLLGDWSEAWAQEARARCARSRDRVAALIGRMAETPVAEAPVAETTPDAGAETSSDAVETALLETDGGAVPLHSLFYIERPADAAFGQALARRDSIVLVKGARQVGKTSLLARGLQQSRLTGTRVVMTDFQKLNEAQLASPDALYMALAASLALQLELDVSPRQAWDPDLGPNMNMELFLRRRVLRAIEGPLVWGMDEVDRLFACPFGSEVFGLFRSWHNERSLDPGAPWARLTLAIAYATEAHLFIQDLNQSPFNVGTRLALDDFTPAHVGELNRRYGSPLPDADIARFCDLLGGQPYLTRRGLRELQSQAWNLSRLEAEGDHDEGPFGDHLRRLLAALTRSPDLLDAVRALLAGKPALLPETFYRLRAAGVVAGASTRDVGFRCHLYATYLAKRVH